MQLFFSLSLIGDSFYLHESGFTRLLCSTPERDMYYDLSITTRWIITCKFISSVLSLPLNPSFLKSLELLV